MKATACRIIVCNKTLVSIIRFQFYCVQINSFPRSGKLISLFGCALQTYSKVGISTCTLAHVSHLVEDTCTCILRLKLYTCTLHNDYRTRSKCCVTLRAGMGAGFSVCGMIHAGCVQAGDRLYCMPQAHTANVRSKFTYVTTAQFQWQVDLAKVPIDILLSLIHVLS